MTHRCSIGMALAALLIGSVAAADQAVVGTVAEREISAEEWLLDTTKIPADAGKPIHQGSRLVTGRPGKLFLNFQDRWAEKLDENSELLITTNVATETGFRFSHQLKNGQVRVLIKEGQKVDGAITTPKGFPTASAHHTDFIVRYDGHTMTVLTLRGEVTFDSGPPFRERVAVAANQIASVAHGQRMNKPKTVDSATASRMIGDTTFIGGGALESQTIDHPSLSSSASPWVSRDPIEPPVVPDTPYPPRNPNPPLKPVFVPLGGVGVRF